MLSNFAYILVFMLIGAGLIALILTLGKLLRPNSPNAVKNSVYECGEIPTGSGFSQFNLRFYPVAFIFVIFDVEIVFMYPVTVVFRELLESGQGMLAFMEIAIFVLILMAGFIYAWRRDGLGWVRSLSREIK